MIPGEHFWIIGSDQEAIRARAQGLRLRDTALILTPGVYSTPAYLFRYPIEGLLAENLLRYEKGALAIDACRLPTGDSWFCRQSKANDSIGTFKTKARVTHQHPGGRYPPNLLFVHGPECRQTGFRQVKASNSPGAGQDPEAKAWAEGAGYRSVPGGAKARMEQLSQDGFETVPAWECQLDCPVRLLDEQSDIGGASRFYPQFENLAGAFDWLVRLIGCE